MATGRIAGGEFFSLATYIAMSSIDALDLPIQFFALGTAAGMLAALVRHRRTGEVDHWPVYVAVCALAMFGFGFLISIAATLF